MENKANNEKIFEIVLKVIGILCVTGVIVFGALFLTDKMENGLDCAQILLGVLMLVNTRRLSRAISVPIGALTDAARKIREGDVEQVALMKDVATDDEEMQMLLSVFDEMTGGVKTQIKTLQENLGHATASFTLSTYAHATPNMKLECARRMDNFIHSVMGE